MNVITFLVHLFIILGKFHIQGQGPSQISSIFFRRLKDYCTSLENIVNKKENKTCNIFTNIQLLITE